MENLVLSFTVVFPLFVQLVLGYGLKRIKLLDDHTLGVCNKLVFRVFLPCLLFLNVYRADLAQVFNARLLAWAAAAILMSFCALMVLIPLIEKDPKKLTAAYEMGRTAAESRLPALTQFLSQA